MKFLLAVIPPLLLVSVQAEIMGWRVPLERLTSELWPSYYEPDYRVPPLDKPPEESAFFKKGDHLLDLSDIAAGFVVIRQQEPSADADPFAVAPKVAIQIQERLLCEWIVWNERSGMIVAKGDPVPLLLLQKSLQLDELPTRIEITFTLTPLVGEPETISLSGRSGEMFKATNQRLEIEVAPVTSDDKSFADIQFAVAYRQPNGEVFLANCSTTLEARASKRVAAWKEGKAGWALDMSWQGFTTSGVPFEKLQWVEREGELVTYSNHREFYKQQQIGNEKVGDLIVRAFDVPPDFLERITGDPVDTGIDPFAPADLPQALKGRISNDLLDVQDALVSHGVAFTHPDSRAIFSPVTSSLIVFNDPINLDLVEQIVGHGGCGQGYNVSIHSDWGLGTAMLATRSGEKASISSTLSDEEFELFEVAPNVASNGHIIDLNLSLEPKSKATSLASAVTLENELETEVARYTNEGEERLIKVKAVIEDGHDY
jgi:hypothetical protein